MPEPTLSIYQNIIHNRTYARKHGKRLEFYPETVDRYIDYLKTKTTDEFLLGELEISRDMIKRQEIMPSMRLFFSAGAAADSENAMAFNCKFQAITSLKSFADLLYSLLCTCGVGISVQQEYISSIPKIPEHLYKTDDLIVVNDNREGWAIALHEYLSRVFKTGQSAKFDTHKVRRKGSPLLISGGYASGPEPLLELRTFIENILFNRTGLYLRSIDVFDIACMIAQCAVQGGVRRAAIITLFDDFDDEMLYSKTKENLINNTHRYNSNNTMVWDGEHSKLDRAFEQTKINGEPGYLFKQNLIVKMNLLGRFSDKGWGVNPCVEIVLRPNQFCVSGDTKLITKNGICDISSVVDKEIDIWNGVKWCNVKPFKTGTDVELYRVHMSDGSYLDVTSYHKFLCKTRFEKKFKEVTTLELIELLKTTKYNLMAPDKAIKYVDGVDCVEAYNYGFFNGDGYIHNNNPYVNVFHCSGKPMDLLGTTKIGNVLFNNNGTSFQTFKFDNIDLNIAKQLKCNEIPSAIFSWNKKSILNFVAGWADADGSNASKGIRVYGNHNQLTLLQLLLTKCDIPSSLNLMEEKGKTTNLGERMSDIWYIQITKTINIPCKRLVCNNSETIAKGKYQLFKSVEKLNGLHDSFCLNEPELHQCVFGNILTKQCNLTETVLRPHHSLHTDMLKVRYSTILGLLQSTLTDYGYIDEETKYNQENDPIIGVSLTGLCDCPEYSTKETYPERLAILKDVANKTVDELWQRVGLKTRPKAITCVKPSGTVSQLVNSSSGIHPRYAKHYIRRVLIGSDSHLYNKLANAGVPYLEFENINGRVFEFPMKSPEESVVISDVNAIAQLNYINTVNQVWCDHNASCTVYVKNDEWEDVKNLLKTKHAFISLSFLPYEVSTNTSGFLYLPYEETTEEDYTNRKNIENSVKWESIINDNTEETTNHVTEFACAGGSCAI